MLARLVFQVARGSSTSAHTRRAAETTAREPYFEGSPYTLY
jgi:hypothetical protein